MEELPRLAPEERRQIFERLCELEEPDLLLVELLNGVEPAAKDKPLLRTTNWRRANSDAHRCKRLRDVESVAQLARTNPHGAQSLTGEHHKSRLACLRYQS